MREIKMNSKNNNLEFTETNSAIQTDLKFKRKETTTQRKRRLEKAKQKRQEKLANETEEEKRLRLDKNKMRLKNESQEHREARLKTYRERYKTARSQETQQQREARLLADREWHTQSRLNERKMGDGKRKETATQRKRRLEKARLYAKRKYEEKRVNESLKDTEIRLIKRRTQRQNQSVEKRNQRLQQIKQLNSQTRSTKTSQRLDQISQNDSVLRALEIPSKRCKRLQMSQQNSQVVASETPSQRSKRLLQMRQNISQLLNKPDLMSTLVEPSHESLQYCLADLQRAMGASDGEMAMLKQLGEIKVEEHSEDDWSDMNVLELCRTTLEEQSVGGNISASDSSTTTIPVSNFGNSLDNCSNSTTTTSASLILSTTKANLQLDTSDEDSSLLPDSTTSAVEPNELLADHTGTEVICPTCFSHFKGFEALQLHISKCHPTSPNSKQCTTLVNTSSKRTQLESTEGNRLVCFVCQQILSTNLMSSHLVDEHSSKPGDIAKCQPVGDQVRNDDNGEEEKFKYKMSDALGDLLDRAANNLITAKQDNSNGMSDIAVQLLNNLCALKKKSTPHQRLHPSTKEMLLKVFDKYCFEAEQKKGANGLKIGNFTCRLCGESFLWESKATWRRHVLEIHARPRARPVVDDLPSHHDETIAAEDELKSQLPISDSKTEQPPTLNSIDKPTASIETEDPSSISSSNSSNSNDRGLRKVPDNTSASTSQSTTPPPRGNQSSSQLRITGRQNRSQRHNKKLRGGSTDSYKRQRLIRIKEDKSAKKRAEDALRELNLSQKVATANKISSGKPVRFRFGTEKV